MKKLLMNSSICFSLFMVCAFSMVPNPMPAPKSGPDACFMPNTTFQGGEVLTYKMYYNWGAAWVSAGEVTFKVQDDGNQYHISVDGHTYKSYEWFYKVRDAYDTYLDKNSLLPIVSERDVAEGKYRLYDKVVFDQATHSATSYRGDSRNDTKTKTFDVKECMHDIVSTIYYARNVDYNQYTKGMTFPVKVFMDGEAFPLSVKYKGKQNYLALRDMGHYNAIKFSPQVVNGRVFKDGSELNVYISDDQNKIPLLIESPLSVGSVKAVLKSYSGLRYDFTAKVD